MNNAKIVCFLVTAAMVGVVFGHGQPYPRPTDEEKAHLSPATPGATEFIKELSERGRYLFTSEQGGAIDAMMKHLDFEAQIKDENLPDTQVDAQFNHMQAEKLLLKFMNTLPELVVLDFTHGLIVYDGNVPIKLPDQSGIVFLKVITGIEKARFSVQEINLGTVPEPCATPIKIVKSGTTYLMVQFDEVPSGKSILPLLFDSDGQSGPFCTLLIERPPIGQLAVEVLDETGKPTPALLRLTAKSSQKLWEPAGAVDLSSIMTSITKIPIYGPGRGYPFYTPGPFKGRYWIVPEPFDMGIPAGQWEIHIHHGDEYIPIHDIFTVQAGQWKRKTYRLKRWTNMNALGWYSGDDHVHARLMNSEDAQKIMAFTKATNINVSNILEMGNQMRTWYAQRGFGHEFRVIDGNHVLVPGQEDPRSHMGHSIGLNLKSLVRDVHKYLLNDWVADEIHKQGGLYGHTHVGEKAFNIDRDMTMLIPRQKSDFCSILQNRLGTEFYYEFLNLGYNVTASAGSDTPYGGAIGAVRTYAYIGKGNPFTADVWFDAVKHGRTFVTNGPMIAFYVNDAMPGDEIVIDDNQPLHIKVKAWGLAGASAPCKVQIVRLGNIFKELVSQNPQMDTLEVDTTVDAGYGFWIAVHVFGFDGTEAHTTPIYVTRKGFRHWNVDNASALIQKRLDTLKDIDDLVTQAQTKLLAHTIAPFDFWTLWPAQQADAVKERTALVRKMYDDLTLTLERELKIRK